MKKEFELTSMEIVQAVANLLFNQGKICVFEKMYGRFPPEMKWRFVSVDDMQPPEVSVPAELPKERKERKERILRFD